MRSSGPVLWLVAAVCAPTGSGIVGQVAVAVARLCAVHRLHRAIWHNERYRFTTWRWGGVVLTLAFVATAMKALA
jgi:hypothetical protein